MLGLSCYILADTFFVARGVGADGLTALNLAIPIYSILHGSGLMIGMGGATRFSITKSKQIFTQSLYYTGIMAIFFLIIGLFFSTSLAALLGANDAVLTNTTIYIKTILCFSPMFLLNNLIICFVRNDGNPRLSMIAMLAGSFSNIILDYIFVFPMKLGLFGAAFATGLAPIISLIILAIHFIRKHNTFHIHKEHLQVKVFKDISKLGVSALITEVSSGIVMIVLNMIILGISGNIGVAAYGIIANIALVIIAIFTGISQGIQPLISHCICMQNEIDTKKIMKYAATTSIVVSLMVYLISFIWTEPIVSLFSKDGDPAFIQIAITGIHIYFTAFLFVGLNILSAAYFSAIDKPAYAFWISITRGFIIIIPMAFILSILFGLTGVWLTLLCTEGIVFLISIILMKKAYGCLPIIEHKIH